MCLSGVVSLILFFQVVDVTWRYSVKQKEVAQRRLLVREEWLSKTLQSFNDWVSSALLTVHTATFNVRYIWGLIFNFNDTHPDVLPLASLLVTWDYLPDPVRHDYSRDRG